MMIITKEYETETAHIVRNAYSTRCRYNVHGHSYRWLISINGDILDGAGMVIDFGNLKWIKEFVDKFDHSMVLWQNEESHIVDFFRDNFQRVIIMKRNCTAENMASLLYKFVTEGLNRRYPERTDLSVSSVKVFETRTGSACAFNYDTFDVITAEQGVDGDERVTRI